MKRFQYASFLSCSAIDVPLCVIHARETWFESAPWHIYAPWPGWLYGLFALWFFFMARRSA